MATTTTLAEVSFSTPRARNYSSIGGKHQDGRREVLRRPDRRRAAPDKLSEKVAENIKIAEEKCSDDPANGECVVTWDKVEALSAAASHKRANEESSNPLETLCKDNPETDECRTYNN
ncbi:hypothetical protein EV1_014286 [Malus domestica]